MRTLTTFKSAACETQYLANHSRDCISQPETSPPTLSQDAQGGWCWYRQKGTSITTTTTPTESVREFVCVCTLCTQQNEQSCSLFASTQFRQRSCIHSGDCQGSGEGPGRTLHVLVSAPKRRREEITNERA